MDRQKQLAAYLAMYLSPHLLETRESKRKHATSKTSKTALSSQSHDCRYSSVYFYLHNKWAISKKGWKNIKAMPEKYQRYIKEITTKKYQRHNKDVL